MDYVVTIIVAFVMGIIWAEVTKNMMKNKGYDKKTCSTWELLGFFFGIFAVIVAATKPAVGAAGGNAVPANNISTADELKKYKDLLDAGAITQAEFDAKKKELLKI